MIETNAKMLLAEWSGHHTFASARPPWIWALHDVHGFAPCFRSTVKSIRYQDSGLATTGELSATDTPPTHYRHTTDMPQTDHYFFFGLHVFYDGVFQNLAFCARVAPNTRKWLPNGSQDPLKMGPRGPKWLPESTQNGSPEVPRRPPKHDSEKRSFIHPSTYPPRLQKDTQNGHPNYKKSFPDEFFTRLKKQVISVSTFFNFLQFRRGPDLENSSKTQ